ncbi:Lrp/AsnC family transcriptional regulator [Siphonobacter aquaeclarae]|jgi:Lrp/AsnC family leucine-responsive transcriptional regulator|uniref:Lrp/AsnC family transcriptional regulator, leucine-responsive regulatory protein n=1 Tax=Siphonobacter aquaeclarae TaxID=563176 RepID=A0A1G9XGZ7_9BACT|nr:Lrp/AsnC family transcriptional regulator [Siphonobacter aquaeclarae]MBO9640933.1 Lrp/AsnC family transcriptional regulator [Siphonobacter aquaeclarae]SDM95990.1 Lrp/AsnC family transcriptional regulator, leucine-responsive regulatory protein [Siphonobacter aquaeclarae]
MLDATDRQILTLLQQDAFISNKELSQRLNLSLTPIHERVKRLEREGYLKGYVGLVDRKKIGRDLIAFCQVSLKEHTQDFIREFEARIGSLPEVVECYNIAGPFDYLLKVVVKDMDDYRRFVVEQLAALAHIGGPQSLFVMAEIKATTALPIDQ